MQQYRIAVIPGNGIGTEVIPVGVKVLEVVVEVHNGFRFDFTWFDWSCRYDVEHGTLMPDDGLKILRDGDAIYLGAVGWPALMPDHVSLCGLLMPIRKQFEQYINLHPCQWLPGIKGPLHERGPEDINFVYVRENSEGEYSNAGGHAHVGTPHKIAVQTNIFTRVALERVMRYAPRRRAARLARHARSANINPERKYPSLFEPVHGSAPDITGLANRQPDGDRVGRRDAAQLPRPRRRHALCRTHARTGRRTPAAQGEAIACAMPCARWQGKENASRPT